MDELGVDPSVRNVKATLALTRYLRRTRPEVLHASVPEADFHASIIAGLGASHVTITDEAGMPKRSFPKRLVCAALQRRVSGVIAVSNALRDYLVQREFVPPSSIRVIPTCANPVYFAHPKSDYSVLDRPFRVVAVGRLVAVKNHSVLIDALSRLGSASAFIELIICGTGPLESALKDAVRKHDLSDRVQIKGYVDDLTQELRNADAFLIPSHSEGCSLSLIEAMASGLPVIASDVPGNREVLWGYNDRWLISATNADDWAKAINELACLDTKSRRDLGVHANELAEARFSPTAHVRALEAYYTDLLKGSRERAPV